MKKIAVVGAGLFGITIACKLGKKYSVDLFEKEGGILAAASGINQFRLHRGYHYPRSPETVRSSLESKMSFNDEYREAIIPGTENFYCISSKNSLTSPRRYLKFLRENKLDFLQRNLKLVNPKSVDLIVQAKESLLDSEILKKICRKKIRESNVNLFLSKKAGREVFTKYDFVVISTYASLNELLKKDIQQELQFELCEKIVVALPDSFSNKSIVILDGPFMCIDPFGTTDLFLMGNVVHAIHRTIIGKSADFPNQYIKLLNKGVIKNPPVTNFKKFIESTKHFIPQVVEAKYRGSMFTIRTVLPYKEKTDERPTIVNQISEKIFTVFSGKLITCVSVANQIRQAIDTL